MFAVHQVRVDRYNHGLMPSIIKIDYNQCYLIRLMASFCFRNSVDISRSKERMPPLNALCDAIALPSGVLAPVDLFHGCHCLIFADCCARCSAVIKTIGVNIFSFQDMKLKKYIIGIIIFALFIVVISIKMDWFEYYYEDCILDNLSSGMSNSGAVIIKDACEKKYPARPGDKRETFYQEVFSANPAKIHPSTSPHSIKKRP